MGIKRGRKPKPVDRSALVVNEPQSAPKRYNPGGTIDQSRVRTYVTGGLYLTRNHPHFKFQERQQISNILCLGNPNDATITDIEGYVFHIFAGKYDPAPLTWGAERNAISKALKTALTLQKELKAIAFHRFPLFHLREDLLPIVNGLKVAADFSIPKGRTPDKQFQQLVRYLAKLFKEKRGKSAAAPSFNETTGEYRGEFFTLAKICVAQRRHMSNVALGQATRRALKKGTKS